MTRFSENTQKFKKMYDYVEKDGTITPKNKIELMQKIAAYKYDLEELERFFKMSPTHGRKLFRDELEKDWNRLMRKKPDAWYLRKRKAEIENMLARGEDPFDYYVKMMSTGDKAGEKTGLFLEFLTIIFRIFSGVSF